MAFSKGIMKFIILSFFLVITSGCSSTKTSPESKHQSVKNTVYTFRLKPGDDIKKSLLQFSRDHSLKAASIISAAGSLTKVSVRFADQKNTSELKGPFEIVSLSGTLSENDCHLHIAVSDRKGQTFGGHLTEGSEIYTTLEVTLIEQNDLEFFREIDQQTTFKELNIRKRN